MYGAGVLSTTTCEILDYLFSALHEIRVRHTCKCRTRTAMAGKVRKGPGTPRAQNSPMKRRSPLSACESYKLQACRSKRERDGAFILQMFDLLICWLRLQIQQKCTIRHAVILSNLDAKSPCCANYDESRAYRNYISQSPPASTTPKYGQDKAHYVFRSSR